MLRDMEQLMAKHWKNPPMELLKPRAISSWTTKQTFYTPHTEAVHLCVCLSPHYLVAVHFVAIFKCKYSSQRDGDAITNNRQSKGVPNHLAKQRHIWDNRWLKTDTQGQSREKGPLQTLLILSGSKQSCNCVCVVLTPRESLLPHPLHISPLSQLAKRLL